MISSTQQLQQDAIGVIIEATIEEDSTIVDLSTVTTKNFVMKKPTGEVITRAASFTTDGTDGKLRYTTVSGDLDVAGTWRLQAELVFPAGYDGRSDDEPFKVKPNL